MTDKKLQRVTAVILIINIVIGAVWAQSYGQAFAKEEKEMKVAVDEDGQIAAGSNNVAADVNTPFSWDNANVYFALTDRFYNGDKSNDHSYGRSEEEKNAADYQNRTGTFHGGDLKGMTEKIEEGYFDELGTNAIWITAPYEQTHGGLCADKFKHYSYHGYYVLDYTNVDANMGTEEELEKFIDTAHAHGIRVIFDVVMNHAGYADAKTASEYGFGKLASNWKEIYYDWDESKYQWYNDYTEEASKNGSQGMMDPSGDWTTNWWGSSWIRALGSRFTGYTGQEQGDDITKCLDGLPDFKTETTADPGIPGILKAKWTKEGTYDEKIAQTKANMSARGLSASVTGYIATWLSDWVEKYGVDGFRCDTAKHIETKEWGKLSSACSKALENWRKNNTDKPGAQWTDDFWMTGEHWGHGVAKDGYYTTGGFDSMINFSYQGNYNKKPQDMDSIYTDYAKKINGDSGFNVLSYISSHDTPSTRSDYKYSLLSAKDGGTSGISLLLLPGGVQTFYGDESGRTEWKTPSGCTGDQIVRSDMNWDSIDTARLEVWQKVGRFRRNHIAVGAGQHKKLAASPYTFSRTYAGTATVGSEKVTDYEDKVVVCLPGKAGTTEVSVGDVFQDGDTVIDEYAGKEYTVSGGKVSATCDSKGVILLAGTGVSKPSVGVSPGSTSYTTDTLTIKLSASQTKSAYYKLDGGAKTSYKNGDTIVIGKNTAVGKSTKVVVGGVGQDGTQLPEKTFTYTKEKEPDYTFYLRIKKSDFKTAPNVYVYSTEDDKQVYSAAWPGDTMETEGDYYVYKSKEYSEARVIFSSNDDTWRYPADMQPGVTVSGYAEYEKDGDVKAFTPGSSSGSKTPAPTQTSKPTATPKPTKTATPKPGNTATPKPNTGNSTTSGFEVDSFLLSKASPQMTGTTIVLATAGRGGSGNYSFKFVVENVKNGSPQIVQNFSKKYIANWTPKQAGSYRIYAYVKDNESGKVKYAIQTYEISKKISVGKLKINRLGKKHYQVSVSASGSGTLQYKFVTVASNGKKKVVKNYSKAKTKNIKFAKTGKYGIHVYIKDTNGIVKLVKKTVKVK